MDENVTESEARLVDHMAERVAVSVLIAQLAAKEANPEKFIEDLLARSVDVVTRLPRPDKLAVDRWPRIRVEVGKVLYALVRGALPEGRVVN